MSTGGLSVRALTADGMPSVALQWIEMQLPTVTPANAATPSVSTAAKHQANAANSAMTVNSTTNDFVRLVKTPLNLRSVLRPARSGKSTLMNLLAGSKTELFDTSSGATTFTKGVYIPTSIMTSPDFSSLEGEPVIDASDPNVKVSFVDTEG
ncbi:uncharacterized protein K489DRAFT_433910 [Dissoconium aciculare CBS 342.82]|uniref:G domain-containing protein n=1 Tax=Dissoconium aciculare CBS 342.82 TaxID=1314786 RepID=A0A6J3LVI4_9PEZI|nr:uncharacterized protein K489DRAFT_433910 [Dissoconium aciculare CBS 342.82]KAF1819775.1 hypothetical protein K489DRAFT_433910 [Dissoconium aciculare CBS 342.82]